MLAVALGGLSRPVLQIPRNAWTSAWCASKLWTKWWLKCAEYIYHAYIKKPFSSSRFLHDLHCRRILLYPMDPNVVDGEGRGAIHFAASCGILNGKKKKCKTQNTSRVVLGDDLICFDQKIWKNLVALIINLQMCCQKAGSTLFLFILPDRFPRICPMLAFALRGQGQLWPRHDQWWHHALALCGGTWATCRGADSTEGW